MTAAYIRPTYHKTAKDHFPENYASPNSTTKLTLRASNNIFLPSKYLFACSKYQTVVKTNMVVTPAKGDTG